MQPDTGPDRSRANTFLLACGIIGSVIFGIINFSFATVTPDYLIIRQPIGDLELLPNGWIQSADFILLGLFTWAFAIGLRRELRGTITAQILPVLHELTAFGLLLTGVFIHNPMHIISSVVVFVSMIASVFVFAVVFKANPQWKGWSIYSIITAVLMMIFACLFAHARITGGLYAGLFERMVMIVRGIWLVIFTIRVTAGIRLTH